MLLYSELIYVYLPGRHGLFKTKFKYHTLVKKRGKIFIKGLDYWDKLGYNDKLSNDGDISLILRFKLSFSMSLFLNKCVSKG